MATGTTKAPAQAPKATPPAPANASAAATPPAAATPKSPKKEGSYHEYFPTLEAAQAKAATLVKGPRQAFTIKCHDGKEYHIIAAHNLHAMGEVAKEKYGWTYVRPEGTSTPRQSKPMNVEAMNAVIASLPADQQAAAKKQLEELTKTLGLKL